MKKWFAMFLVSLMLMTCCGSTLAVADEEAPENFTFEMFYSDVGLPYEGEWVCFDEALYVYLPTELTKEAVTEEMKAAGMLANYSSTDEQGVTLQIQIAKQGKKDSIAAIQAEYEAFCDQTVYITINDIPVVAAYSGRELYAEALMKNGEAYLMKVGFANDLEDMDIDNKQGMYVYGMLYSISAMPLEIDEEKVGIGVHRMEQEEEAMREDIPIRLSSEIRIQFEYKDGREEDLDQINQMLATMKLTDLDVDDLSVYLCETQHFDQEVVVGTTYRCGLSSGVLVCKEADFEKTYRYQIATEVLEGADAMEDGTFADYWRENYPGRKLSTVATYGFDTHTAVVVVYFEEIVE